MLKGPSGKHCPLLASTNWIISSQCLILTDLDRVTQPCFNMTWTFTRPDSNPLGENNGIFGFNIYY